MKILIVDDNKSMTELLTDILEIHGFETAAVNDPDSVMKSLSSVNPDMVLLDITMPGVDGFSLCRLIKSGEQKKHIKIIMFSARDLSEDREKAKQAGADGFITKTTSPAEIVRTINEILA